MTALHVWAIYRTHPDYPDKKVAIRHTVAGDAVTTPPAVLQADKLVDLFADVRAQAATLGVTAVRWTERTVAVTPPLAGFMA